VRRGEGRLLFVLRLGFRIAKQSWIVRNRSRPGFELEWTHRYSRIPHTEYDTATELIFELRIILYSSVVCINGVANCELRSVSVSVSVYDER
jgi:hypothetical protein